MHSSRPVLRQDGFMEQVEVIVIGAGVVGLALARELALQGKEVLILEAQDRFGTGTSSRNSEVVHAGIYYPQGSLKARLCVEGKQTLYAYCEAHGIDHRRCGKLIVATETSQLAALGEIKAKAQANGVDDLEELTQAQAQALEPELRCVGALQSPSTGIVDSHGLMATLLAEAEDHGALFVPCSPVLGGEATPQGLVLEVGGADPTQIQAQQVYNAAGLGAQSVARNIHGVQPESIPQLHLAKGNYYGLSGKAPFSRLVYPVPEAAGLGVHLTLDLGGQARFGPDVEWVATENYDVDPRRADGFYAEIRKYWPSLPDGALQPAYAGIRPKLQGPSDPAKDFMVQGEDEHGVSGLVNLFGIESPGLTACLALAAFVTRLSNEI